MAKLIFGCGYLGLRVARRWLAANEVVYGVTRSSLRARELVRVGVRPVVGDVTESVDLTGLSDVDTVLYAIGFDRSSGKTIRQVYVVGLQRALQSVPQSVGRLIYVSSTGVYGQTGGEWVDEESPCEPLRVGGQACVEAEQLLGSSRLGDRAAILRLAGIYGPQRIPRMEAVAAGQPLPILPSAILNLIHVDDAAAVVLAAERSARLPCTYTVSDGHPARRADFYTHLAELLGAPPPQFVTSDSADAPRQRDLSNKRVSNRRLLRELQVELQFPSYRDGLSAIVGSEAAG